MARWLAIVLLLCACREKERPAAEPVVAATPDAARAVIDVAAILPKQPGVFGPWARFPIGTTHDEIKKTAPELLAYQSGTPRFDGIFRGGQLAGYRIELDEKDAAAVEAAWGPPEKITDARGTAHAIWSTADLHIEQTDGTKLVMTNFVPLASFLGKKGFAFEAERSLVGLPAADAVAQIQKWADAKKLPMSVEGDIDALASAMGTTADKVVVVGDGSATPLSKMAVRSIDVALPPAEGSFEKVEYNFTRLRIWLDEQGVVKHYWFDIWVDPAGHAAATALLAKTYGKPSTSGESLRYPVKPVVCFPREPRPYATISVGECK